MSGGDSVGRKVNQGAPHFAGPNRDGAQAENRDLNGGDFRRRGVARREQQEARGRRQNKMVRGTGRNLRQMNVKKTDATKSNPDTSNEAVAEAVRAISGLRVLNNDQIRKLIEINSDIDFNRANRFADLFSSEIDLNQVAKFAALGGLYTTIKGKDFAMMRRILQSHARKGRIKKPIDAAKYLLEVREWTKLKEGLISLFPLYQLHRDAIKNAARKILVEPYATINGFVKFAEKNKYLINQLKWDAEVGFIKKSDILVKLVQTYLNKCQERLQLVQLIASRWVGTTYEDITQIEEIISNKNRKDFEFKDFVSVFGKNYADGVTAAEDYAARISKSCISLADLQDLKPLAKKYINTSDWYDESQWSGQDVSSISRKDKAWNNLNERIRDCYYKYKHVAAFSALSRTGYTYSVFAMLKEAFDIQISPPLHAIPTADVEAEPVGSTAASDIPMAIVQDEPV